MTPERWRRIEDLYHRASEQPVATRRAFVEAACADDPDLRREVDALLAHSDSGDQLLRPPMALAAAMISGSAKTIVGRRLGHFEIRSLLGAGGMGEVYRARDTRLGRDVALKILPEAFADNPERLARFEREARVLAALNHANIATIYGVEDAADVRAIVMEFVDGDTLADRLKALGARRQPLPVADALAIARQIADALDAAHEKGIIHRDLKPANVAIAKDGVVKVLDFGLAKAIDVAAGAGPDDQSSAPTIAADRTSDGVILGTAAYMSPEQARGQALDKRTDIWAFGCVLFEMVTGRPAFAGATMPDIVAQILERDPDWAALPAATPDPVRRVLRWALAKDPQRRLRDLADARLELETTDTGEARADLDRARRGGAVIAAWIAAVILSAIIGAVGSRRLQTSTPESTRFTSRFAIPVGPLEVLPRNVAMSPDGRYLAYLAGPSGNQKTYLRGVGDHQSRVIAELPMQAPQPFFSPDSQWVAFFDAGKLKKLLLGGGAPVTLAEAPTPRGGTWGPDGSIVFAPISRGGLMWLPSAAGPPQVLTTPDDTRGETSHRFPTFLPQSRTVLFVAESSSPVGRSLQSVSLDTKRIGLVSAGDGVLPRYVPTGHLAQVINGKLVVAPFDVNTLRITAAPVTVVNDVDSFSFSNDGTLVYSEAPAYNIRASTVVWTSRNGSVAALPLPPAVYDHPRLAPDGSRIVIHRAEVPSVDQYTGPANGGLWLYDTARDTLSKFTLTVANDWPLWSPDGSRIFYASNRPATQYDVFSKPADGSGPEQVLLTRPLTQIPRAASPTGDALIYEETYADRPNTLWRMSLRGSVEDRPLFGKGAGEMMPTFSPDGRWVGYVSPQSGRNEVFVRSSTGEGSIWPISNAGGVEPVWSSSGQELFYRADDKMMAVEVIESATISFGKPHLLFEGTYIFGATEGQEFDVSRDGSRFLMLKPQRAPEAIPLNVIVNWFDDLRRRVAGPK